MPKQLTTEDIVKRGKELYGDKYVYDKTHYVDRNTKVTITCKLHGDFRKDPKKFLYYGRGCPICSRQRGGELRQTTREELIEGTKEKFSDYDFSRVPNKFRQKDKIWVGCPKHGFFLTCADSLLHGYGCKKCQYEHLSELFSWTLDEFLKRANDVHGNDYIYDMVKYHGIDNEVEIICPKHGIFKQTPYCHIHLKQGCPICKSSSLENEVRHMLEDNGINFIQGAKRDTLKWIGRQHLDFYLPKYKIGVECQGEQHYEEVEYFGGEESFSSQQERDIRKMNLCKQNGVELIYFTHYDDVVEDNVETFKDKEKLLEFIKSRITCNVTMNAD